eukprot:CAMPEP_0168568980 /NCGR_PEP_ID=MMETSP0413-20121227/15881_1 /TAXON_ID=136452 /ORGANISM="Filamoeba nolandi, Strain NC-AS-23-1" /LENGTH=323 /DNA_ID=CAMNT_0008601381 /DNA_START=73 /DNA_END=1041 /DNA_ORIENTATION=+
MNEIGLLTFNASIDAEVERAYGVVIKFNFSQLPELKEQTIAVLDRYVATDKLVKRANKIGCVKNTEARYQISAWIEVEHKDGREVIESCCGGKCKERQGIAFFRTWAFQVKQLADCGAPMIFFGAPSHNHRGKKAKFILKLALFENETLIATSEDVFVPYKQSSTITKPLKNLKRQRSESELDDSDVTSPPSSPEIKKPATESTIQGNNKSITKLTNNINNHSILSLMPAINYSTFQPAPFNTSSEHRALQSYMKNYGTVQGIEFPTPSPAWPNYFSMNLPYDFHSMWNSGGPMGLNTLRSQSFSFPNASFLPIPEDYTCNTK